MTPAASADGYAGKWRALVYACHYIDRSVVGIVIEPLRKELRLSDGQLGALAGLILRGRTDGARIGARDPA